MQSRPADEGLAARDRAPASLSGESASLAYQPHMTDEELALVQARRTLRFIYASRDCFPAIRDLADHPGWEILLHLFIAGREGRQFNTIDLCARTGAWRPLAVRYIEMLFERDLVDRDVTGDKPETWLLRLTRDAEARLQELLCGFARHVSAADAAGALD